MYLLAIFGSLQVFFNTEEAKPIAIMALKVEPQPHVIDQTFRLHHPEQSFLKKSIRLPSLHTLPGEGVTLMSLHMPEQMLLHTTHHCETNPVVSLMFIVCVGFQGFQ